jgi:hypothetical protein
MSEPILQALKESSSGSYALFEKIVSACPQDLWESSFGGWPLWQQYMHTLWVNLVFLPGEPQLGLLPEMPQAAVQLEEKGANPISREDAGKCLEGVKKATFAYLDSLKDSDLPKTSKKMGETEFSNMKTIGLLNGHIMYHLGVFDAALREKGQKGII